MTVDLIELLKSNKIFGCLDDLALKNMLDHFEKIHLKRNKILFKQGDVSTHIYLLVSGKLAVLLEKNKLIKEIFSGETLGELSALSQEPRSVTVKAREDSILLQLPSEFYRALIAEYPVVGHKMLSLLVDRSRNLMHMLSGEKRPKKHIVVIPANKESSVNTFAEKMIAQIKDSKIAYLSDSDAQVVSKNTLTQLAEQKQHIIYFLSSPESALAKIALENADMVYVVGEGVKKPSMDRISFPDKVKPELILLHENAMHLPVGTTEWLKLMDFDMHHHIRIEQEKDFQRMLRFMRGEAIGLVLSGGGVRSWAHLGVIKALFEANIPIDFIGGTSAGAIISGFYALNETFEDKEKKLHHLSRVTSGVVSLNNATWPAVSIFDGDSYTHALRRLFGKAKMQDVWLPNFSISCRISDNTQVIHRRGALWKKVRSSTAVPAIFPPVVIRGKMHLDGGILNNFPVDQMRKILGPRGKIIGSELIHKEIDENEYHFPEVLPFWKVTLSKLRLGYRNYKFPHFINTFLRSLLAGASAKQKENALLADLLIAPDLSDFSLLSITESQESELMEVGYQAAKKALKKFHLDR